MKRGLTILTPFFKRSIFLLVPGLKTPNVNRKDRSMPKGRRSQNTPNISLSIKLDAGLARAWRVFSNLSEHRHLSYRELLEGLIATKIANHPFFAQLPSDLQNRVTTLKAIHDAWWEVESHSFPGDAQQRPPVEETPWKASPPTDKTS